MEGVTQEQGESIDMEHVADSAVDEIKPGMILKGEIVTVDTDFAYVNVGTKSDGRIPLNEFDENPEIGENVDVVLHNKNFVDGMYQFSKNAAEIEKRWQAFNAKRQEGVEIIEGRVTSATNKGKIVDCGGIHAFLPFSLSADLKTVSSTDEGCLFKIKSVDNKKKSLVVSRKDYLDEEIARSWEVLMENYNIGDTITGKVVKFVEFGAFVRVEGIDALLHRNDMTWKKIFKQRKILKLNEEREFKILDINREEGKISLGLKQLTEDPWLSIDERIKTGDVISGEVVTITNYGAFIEIEEGIEGFISNSDLSWTKNIIRAGEMFKKGDTSEFIVLDINKEERKISLGYRQLTENPWETIDEKFPVGSVHTTKVKKLVKFGMFVGLDGEIDGLVHLSDMSWNENVKDASSIYKVGDEIKVKILDIKKDEMKISCGVKQLEKSPWEIIREKYPKGSRITGEISGITQFGLFVKLEDDVEGLAHISEVARKKAENLEEHYSVGESIGVVVLGVDVEKRRLSLSVKQYEAISEKEELDKIMKNTSPSTVTLGDIVNIKLGE